MDVRGRNESARYSDGWLTIVANESSQLITDALLGDLAKVVVVRLSSDEPGLAFHFKSPDFLVDGVPAGRVPLVIALPQESRTSAQAFADTIAADLLAARRVDPTVDARMIGPPPHPSRVWRSDVAFAFERLDYRRDAKYPAAELHRLDGPESVLALAVAEYDDTIGVVAATSQRLLFAAPGADTLELPVTAIESAAASDELPSALPTLTVSNGGTTYRFTNGNRDDLERVADALRAAIGHYVEDAAIYPDSPTSADLFAEWQILHTRRAQYSDREFRRHLTGILLTLP